MKNKLVVIAIAFLTAAAAAGLLIAAFQTRGDSLSANQRSADLPEDAAKIAFLKRYFKMYSEIDATEFHIVYQDNSRGVPGPSYWDMQVVMKMPPERVSLWTVGLLPASDKSDLAWGYALLPKTEAWAIHTKPKIFARGNTVVATFEPEGVVFKRAVTN